MANGNPGDHPLTDILVHNLEVYGPEVDELIRRSAQLCSRRELDKWWESEIGWSHALDHAVALRKAKAFLEGLLHQARTSGWEVSNDS